MINIIANFVAKKSLSFQELITLQSPSIYPHVIPNGEAYDATAQALPYYMRFIRVGGAGDIKMDVFNANGTGQTEIITLTGLQVGEVIDKFYIKKIYDLAGGTTATALFVC